MGVTHWRKSQTLQASHGAVKCDIPLGDPGDYTAREHAQSHRFKNDR